MIDEGSSFPIFSPSLLAFNAFLFLALLAPRSHSLELIEPIDGGDACKTVLFDWKAVEGRDLSYRIIVATDEQLMNVVNEFPKTVTSSFSAEADMPTGTLYWSVSVLDQSDTVLETSAIYSYDSDSCITGGAIPVDSNPGFVTGLVSSDLTLASLGGVTISVNGEYFADVAVVGEEPDVIQFTDEVVSDETGHFVIQFDKSTDLTLTFDIKHFEEQTLETMLTKGAVNTSNAILTRIPGEALTPVVNLLLKE